MHSLKILIYLYAVRFMKVCFHWRPKVSSSTFCQQKITKCVKFKNAQVLGLITDYILRDNLMTTEAL